MPENASFRVAAVRKVSVVVSPNVLLQSTVIAVIRK